MELLVKRIGPSSLKTGMIRMLRKLILDTKTFMSKPCSPHRDENQDLPMCGFHRRPWCGRRCRRPLERA